MGLEKLAKPHQERIEAFEAEAEIYGLPWKGGPS